jgi:xylan 1,4-beta-xylosidase
MDISIDFSRTVGDIRPLHGVNNGPVGYGSLVDVTRYYVDLGIPWVRIHDSNWPHPREIDYYCIFPDFEKDVDDPENYDFRTTDDYIQSILKTGARIVYRLGVSIEHTANKYHVHPPDDFDKWADICVHIIRHYNEGWADGFHYDISHWEIWNEPEGGPPGMTQQKNPMWSGTMEQYFELYRTASTKIRECCPDVKIGGFAYTYVHPEYLERFLEYVAEHRLPLDFFSWHTYTGSPTAMAEHAWNIKRKLDQYGFQKTQIHCNEYNYSHPLPEGMGIFGPDNQLGTEMYFEALKSEFGASFDAAVLILLQDCPVDVLNYYDAAPMSYWSFFNCYGVPQKAYYAFEAFKEVFERKNRVETVVSEECKGIYCLGALDRDMAAVLVSSFDASGRSYDFTIRLPAGRRKARMQVWRLDAGHEYGLDITHDLESDSTLSLPIEDHSVLLLRLVLE